MMRWLFYGVVLWSYGVSLAYAGINHDSNLDWKTQESAHFRIHFYAGEQVLANRSLHIAESVYARLTPILNWYPQEKTEIVLSDEMDMSNGFALPIPSNRITLFVSRPNSVNSLEDHAGWLETLILHEFVHTLHLDKAKGGPRNSRNIFGRMFLAFPNVFMPAWMHEGLATYHETDQAMGIGRGQSSYFQMMMRMEVEIGIKPLRQINQPLVSWPLGTSRYLYGVYFYQFIADTYGKTKVQSLVESYSGHWLPFSINTLYEDVLGKDLSAIWDEFEGYVNQKFQTQAQQIQQTPLVVGKALTQSGDLKPSIVQADDGRIFFVRDHLSTGSDLVMLVQGEQHVIRRLNSNASLDWHEQAGMLLTQPDTCNNANTFFDIYRVDVQTGEQTQLTHCQRYIAATWSPDGQRIIAIKNELGQHALHLLDNQGNLKEVLWQGQHAETLSGIDWSADGLAVVSSVWRKGTAWDLEAFDLQHKTWSKLTHDMHIQTDARFVQDSRDIVFSMDKDGVYNIYRRDYESGKVMQLTHVLGGAFHPFIGRSGALLSSNYSAQGFDVYALQQPMDKQVELDDSDAAFERPQFPQQDVQISAPKPYSAWDSALPTSWLPSFSITNEGAELGAFVFGSDVLNRHSYSLYAGYQSVSSSPVFNLDYIYDGWYPQLKVHAGKLQTPNFDKANSLVALVENQRLDAELIFPWLHQQQNWSAHLAGVYRKDELAWLNPNYTATGLRYRDVIAGMAMVYDSRITFSRGISKTSTGSYLALSAESGKSLGGNYTGNVLMLSGKTFFDLSHEQVLAVRLDVGKGDNNTRDFRLGGTINGSVVPNVLNTAASASFNRRSFALRGYGELESALTGKKMALISAEYRFPIARVERGLMAPPIGLHQIFGQFFVDSGRAGNDLSATKTYTGIGFELGADAILFYNIPIRMQLGYAKGLDDVIGGNQAYFRLGSTF